MSAAWNFDLYIDGKWTPAERGGRIEVIDPATEAVIGSAAESPLSLTPMKTTPGRPEAGKSLANAQIASRIAVGALPPNVSFRSTWKLSPSTRSRCSSLSSIRI